MHLCSNLSHSLCVAAAAQHGMAQHAGCLWAGSLLCSAPTPHVCVPMSSPCIEPGVQECQQHVKNPLRGTMMFLLLTCVPLWHRAGWGYLSDPFATCAVHRRGACRASLAAMALGSAWAFLVLQAVRSHLTQGTWKGARSPALPFPFLAWVFFIEPAARAATANHTHPCRLWRESPYRVPALAAHPRQRLCCSVPPKHNSSLDFI